MPDVQLGQFDRLIEIVREKFPHLRIVVDHSEPDVHASADLKAQPGLLFDVNISLQCFDELFLNAGELYISWFPIDNADVFDKSVVAVLGLLSGSFRIVESYIGSAGVSAVLQRPAGNDWVTVCQTSSIDALIPWPRRKRVLQNVRAA